MLRIMATSGPELRAPEITSLLRWLERRQSASTPAVAGASQPKRKAGEGWFLMRDA